MSSLSNPSESATEQQEDQDDSSSLSELEPQEQVVLFRDGPPAETLSNGCDLDLESNTRSSSEDAIIQDSQPVYHGRPIGSSSPVDAPYQDDVPERLDLLNQTAHLPAESEYDFVQNAKTDEGVTGEIHNAPTQEDLSLPSKDSQIDQALPEDETHALPSSSTEASYAEQTDEHVPGTIHPQPSTKVMEPASSENINEAVVNDEAKLNRGVGSNSNEDYKVAQAQESQSSTMQDQATKEGELSHHIDNEVQGANSCLSSTSHEKEQVHRLNTEAAVKPCISETVEDNPESGEQPMPRNQQNPDASDAPALLELQQSIQPLQSIAASHPAETGTCDKTELSHSKTFEILSNDAEMDADMETSNSVPEAQVDGEAPSTMQTAPHQNTLERSNSQPSVTEQETNFEVLAAKGSYSQQDIPSDCLMATAQDRLSQDSAAHISLGLPELESRDSRDSKSAMLQDTMASVVKEGGESEPTEENESGEPSESEEAIQGTQDIGASTTRERSPDALEVTTKDLENVVSSANATDSTEPTMIKSTTHDTPLKRATQAVDSSSTPSSVSRLHKDSRKGQTYVGGMLASNKAMRPFRSPMIARKEGTPNGKVASGSDSVMQTSTPSKASSGNGTKVLPGRRSMLSSSTMSHGTSAASPVTSAARAPSKTLHTSMKTGLAGNVALNKPFKSLFSKTTGEQAIDSDSCGKAAPEMIDIDGKPMSIFQLSTSLHKLERRLALLKDAKRHRIARERGLDSADNTDHIRELSTKWLEKGREAAELLWELVKDNMEAQGNDQHGDSGFGGGFDNDKNQSNWGWDTSEEPAKVQSAKRRRHYGRTSWDATNTSIERLREKVSMAIDELPEDERQALYKETEAEGSLPELDPDMIISRMPGTRELTGGRNGPSKKARFDSNAGTANNDDKQDHTNDEADPDSESEDEESRSEYKEVDDSDALSDTAHDEEEKQSKSQNEEEDEEMDVEDDPNGRGMAKMLMSCGIE